MALNLTKLNEMARPRNAAASARAKDRLANREWLKLSHEIALTTHHYLRTAGITQKELAERMNVSPAYIGKLLKGSENLTLETICKLQQAIGEELVSIARPYISRTIVSYPTAAYKFSEKAANSEKFCNTGKSFNTYTPAGIEAA